MKNIIKTQHPYRRSAILIIFILLATYILLPQLSSFQSMVQTVQHADKAYLILAVIFFSATYFAASLSYCLISYFKLPYWPTLLVQVADGFTNRIFPAGIGGIATNVLYLIKRSRSGIKAGYVAGLNNIVGFVAHMIILAALLLVSGQSVHGLIHVNTRLHFNWWVIILALLAALLTAVFWHSLSRLSIRGYHYLLEVLKASFRNPYRLLGGLAAAMLVTICYALTLEAVLLALNVHLMIIQVFIVLTVSVLAIAITPTPGGIGAAEAGLVAALINFNVGAAPALSAALVYRFITYWLPLIPGALALRRANNQSYLARPDL
ncbi:MAG: lysylphosphatidylglycerol synthase transmembrane domain-containing protein [Candidatus Saccharimonadales bacterium]